MSVMFNQIPPRRSVVNAWVIQQSKDEAEKKDEDIDNAKVIQKSLSKERRKVKENRR